MAWHWIIDSGKMLDARGKVLARGYSGNTIGLNNPFEQDRVGVGPLPVGTYTIGPPHAPVDHLGPVALPLWPAAGNDMRHRCGFFIHGDNQRLNHTASNGCIILALAFRDAIRFSRDHILIVVATAADTIPEVA